MPVLVKICGISSSASLDAAIESKADFVGFVFYPRSRRHVGLVAAESLRARAADRIMTVALIVDATNAEVSEISSRVRPDFLQLHGEETVSRVLEIRALSKTPVIKAVKVSCREDIATARAYEGVAERILFDAHVPPSSGALPGGNGVIFDWTWLRNTGLRPDFMLSGGLTRDNVERAILVSGTGAVDVSSGVEDAPGMKSTVLIQQFVHNARKTKRAVRQKLADVEG